MATKDVTLVLKGDQAVVRKIEIMINKDGSYAMRAYGETKTGAGLPVGLDVGINDSIPADPHLDAVWAQSASVLRKSNGLE